MISTLRQTSGQLRLIVFDLGLSAQQRSALSAADAHHELRPPPPPDECPPDCRPQMLLSLLPLLAVVAWADPGGLPPWDLRALLTDFPAGTSFVAARGPDGPGRSPLVEGGGGGGADNVSTAFLAVYPDVRLYHRVLLPWAACGPGTPGPDCPAPTSARRRLAALPSPPLRSAPAASHRRQSERALAALLDDFRLLFPAAVSGAVPPPIAPGGPPGPRGPPAPALLRVSESLRLDRPVLAYVPLHGPNNQLSMLCDAAAVARRLGARALAPPLAPHYARTERPGVAQRPGLHLPADALFSAHFLHQHAVLAGPDSSWAGLLGRGQVELVIFDRGGAPPAMATVNCTAEGSCAAGQLVGVPSRSSAPAFLLCSSFPSRCPLLPP